MLSRTFARLQKSQQLGNYLRNPNTTNSLRCFSTDNNSENMSPKDLKKALIRAGFVHAQRVGFNDQCLVEACNDLELPSVRQKSSTEFLPQIFGFDC